MHSSKIILVCLLRDNISYVLVIVGFIDSKNIVPAAAKSAGPVPMPLKLWII